MIKSCNIVNYQTHKNTNLKFVDGMNVITGISSNGKTAIIRALLWALNNRPAGESFKRWGTTDKDNVSVSIEFDDDMFTKNRTKGKNQYVCSAGTFEALRSDVPEVIQQIANMTDYNVLTQHEPFFMLQASPGERAKKMNDLVGLSIVDKVIKRLTSKVQAAKSEMNKLVDTCNGLIYEISAYNHLDDVAVYVNKLDDDIADYLVTSSRLDLMRSLHEKLIDISAQSLKFDSVLSIESILVTLQEKISNYSTISKSLSSMSGIESTLAQVQESLVDQQKFTDIEPDVVSLQSKVMEHSAIADYLGRMKSDNTSLFNVKAERKSDEDWLVVESPYNQILAKLEEYQNVIKRCNTLNNFDSSLTKLIAGREESCKNLNLATIKYTDLLGKYGVCPTCFSELDTSSIASIQNKLYNEGVTNV